MKTIRGNIVEIFYSIQGEFPNFGQPSIFIRFGGCNLSCSFCDTKYANTPEGYSSKTVANVFEQIENIRASNIICNDIIITGGEPTIQMDFLEAIINRLKPYEGCKYNKISIETNGTNVIPYRILSRIDTVGVSPKVMNPEYIPAMNRLIEYNNSTFKIVHTSDKDVEDIIHYYKIPKHKIIIMTEAATQDDLRRKEKDTWEFCKTNGYRMGYRLHIEIFDTKRGV